MAELASSGCQPPEFFEAFTQIGEMRLAPGDCLHVLTSTLLLTKHDPGGPFYWFINLNDGHQAKWGQRNDFLVAVSVVRGRGAR